MTFTAQQLSHRIELQRMVSITNTAGETEITWTCYAIVYARIDPVAGREYFAAQAVQAENTVKFTTRWRDDVKASDRLVFAGSHYDITAALNIGGRNRELLIYARTLA